MRKFFRVTYTHVVKTEACVLALDEAEARARFESGDIVSERDVDSSGAEVVGVECEAEDASETAGSPT